MKRILWLLVILPLGALLIALAVANRNAVTLVLDPFRPASPAFSISLPFYAYLLGALILGVALGGTATWLRQGRWRRSARTQGRDAARWQAEADRLVRERDKSIVEGKALALGAH